MVKLAKEKNVKVSNGRTFPEKYERRLRSKKGVLPANVHLKS